MIQTVITLLRVSTGRDSLFGWQCGMALSSSSSIIRNTGDLYYGHGFEMVAVLEANLCPITFSAAFATLLPLFNDKQERSGINEFWDLFEVIKTLFLGQWSVSPQFFRSCFSCGLFVLVTKQSLN